jgi:hypothetical protein
MFSAPGLVFNGTEGVDSRFHVFQGQTHFRRYRRRQVAFSSFRPQTHFRRCRGRRVSISSFVLSDTFSAARRASGPVFVFCSPRHVFGGAEGVESCFHVWRSQTRFRRFRGCRVPFSCFASPLSFSSVPRASGLVFLFCAAGIVFDGSEGVESRFHILRVRTRFRRYRGRRHLFSSFARTNLFPAVPTAT